MNEILGVQIIGILFALFMFYITFLHQRRKEFTVKESIFWFGSWSVFLILVVFPTSLDFIVTDVLQFSRRMDFFIVIGFIFVIGMLFHTYTIVRKSQKRIEEIVINLALKEGKKKK